LFPDDSLHLLMAIKMGGTGGGFHLPCAFPGGTFPLLPSRLGIPGAQFECKFSLWVEEKRAKECE
jgi:hypothetical protein